MIPLDLHPDRLFPAEPSTRRVARTLYETVRDLPIVSPHGHTDPAWFAIRCGTGSMSASKIWVRVVCVKFSKSVMGWGWVSSGQKQHPFVRSKATIPSPDLPTGRAPRAAAVKDAAAKTAAPAEPARSVLDRASPVPG